jgi:protoporphyrinogen/coproporphyrinogen III oxidase
VSERRLPAVAPVVVVGGGMGGLSAAYELHRRAIPAIILEASDRLGGLLLTESADGFVIDAGPDSLLSLKSGGLQLARDLGLGSRLTATQPPRSAFILRGGRLHPLPEGAVLGVPTRLRDLAGTSLFSFAGKLRMCADLTHGPRASASDESIASFMERHFGREAVTYLAEPLLAGIHAGDVDRLSVQALFPRLVDAEAASGSLIRAFARARTAGDALAPAFHSFPRGLGELLTALEGALTRETLFVDSAVSAITREPNGYAVHIGAGTVVRTPAVVLATPAWMTGGLLAALDGDLAASIASTRYVSTATIVLAYRRSAVAHPLNGSGFVVPRTEGRGLLAATWVSSKWAGRAPEGYVLLRGFVGGTRDPSAVDLATDDLQGLVHRELAELLGIAGPPVLGRVYRWRKTGAQYEVGHLDRVGDMDRGLASHRGLFVTGSGYRGVGLSDVIADARATARLVERYLGERSL